MKRGEGGEVKLRKNVYDKEVNQISKHGSTRAVHVW